ncbi:hypothetical protein [Sphingobacterium faecium]|uniref:hypothetical protein n=1 Tax=Sphingobacterium faecium TaxID=34087 RepID=UPI00320A0D13
MNYNGDNDTILTNLRSLDLETSSVEEILDLYRSIDRQFFLVNELKKGTRILRARIWDEIPNIPTNICELSYNPSPSKYFGRAHCVGDMIFYGSINPDDLKVRDYFNAPLEVLHINKEEIGRKYFVISSWVLQRDIIVASIGTTLPHAKLFQEKRGRTIKSFKGLDENFRSEALKFDDFICAEFSKVIKDDDLDHYYKFSATYSKFILEHGIDGILYPSVASNGGGINVAIRKELIDSQVLIPEHALYGTFFNRYKEVTQEYSMFAETFGAEGEIRWKESYRDLLNPSIKNYYIGKSDINPLAQRISYTSLD